MNLSAEVNECYENTKEKEIVSNIIENNVKNTSETILKTNLENNLFKESKLEEKENWILEIPKINLKAEISEGTARDILDKYIGHFEETSMDNGNIGLAAHNRGYKVNYFEKIKELEIGDEIFYTYNGITKKYIVKIKTIIKDTDWSFLENTKENILTLITCVEDKPEYRRCIQAVLIK